MHLEASSPQWPPFCFDLSVLKCFFSWNIKASWIAHLITYHIFHITKYRLSFHQAIMKYRIGLVICNFYARLGCDTGIMAGQVECKRIAVIVWTFLETIHVRNQPNTSILWRPATSSELFTDTYVSTSKNILWISSNMRVVLFGVLLGTFSFQSCTPPTQLLKGTIISL